MLIFLPLFLIGLVCFITLPKASGQSQVLTKLAGTVAVMGTIMTTGGLFFWFVDQGFTWAIFVLPILGLTAVLFIVMVHHLVRKILTKLFRNKGNTDEA